MAPEVPACWVCALSVCPAPAAPFPSCPHSAHSCWRISSRRSRGLCRSQVLRGPCPCGLARLPRICSSAFNPALLLLTPPLCTACSSAQGALPAWGSPLRPSQPLQKPRPRVLVSKSLLLGPTCPPRHRGRLHGILEVAPLCPQPWARPSTQGPSQDQGPESHLRTEWGPREGAGGRAAGRITPSQLGARGLGQTCPGSSWR